MLEDTGRIQIRPGGRTVARGYKEELAPAEPRARQQSQPCPGETPPAVLSCPPRAASCRDPVVLSPESRVLSCRESGRKDARKPDRRAWGLNLGDDIVKVVIDWSKLQSISALQPTLLFSALQQHILCLQPLLEKLQSLIKEENIGHVEPAGKTEGQTCETSLDVYDGNCQTEEKYASYELGDLKDAHINFDPEVVQIKAGKAEIDRRISAFMEGKQAEIINENFVREFCNVIDCNQENSCARTDAIFTPYPGFKSHIKVSRVVNTYGPQTRSEGVHGSSHKANVPIHDCGNQAVEERLQNIEAHLRLQTGGPVPRDIYQRIKKLEDKILELEGLSPEYFQSVSCSGKRRKVQPPHQNYSLAELDEKINAIKQALLRKTKESKSKEVERLLR
ncbi:PREDICTED: LOW QUALITY PROTEIN: MAP3K12-binding inhibitory protein 1 [Aptenodytes forsteri]|uniref:LOW QUALITY PROTEIN: MAP3K12-binding inhibitory protein 1 n=1 Tax=Aptenodytes forsteri TaxID=9233 RepID=UPI00090498A2|nr:PREDICTED: LOW QUALITY PROTEIN: MAP3K12-binding inhibitory protein 1 [Aptenodytes forsteri]